MKQEELEDKFSIFVPFEFSKAEESVDKYKDMKIKGTFSSTKYGPDSDGETLEPEGMDFSELVNFGHLNWHHAWSKDPLAIVGEPIKAELRNGEPYVEGKLYSDSEKARGIYDLAQILEKSGSNRRLGFSLEGKALVRDKKNKNRVLKSRITGLAITPSPKCKGTAMELLKGDVSDWSFEDANGGRFEDTTYLVDVVDESGVRRTVDKDFNIKVWPLEKSITTESIAPGTPESVEHDKKKVKVKQDTWLTHNKDNLVKNLQKAELYVDLLQQGYSKEECKQLVILSEAIERGEIEFDLEKGGEGSRGGKVIGHTKSGKAIYATSDPGKHHKDFTEQEHTEAFDLLRKKPKYKSQAYRHLGAAERLEKKNSKKNISDVQIDKFFGNYQEKLSKKDFEKLFVEEFGDSLGTDEEYSKRFTDAWKRYKS